MSLCLVAEAISFDDREAMRQLSMFKVNLSDGRCLGNHVDP